MYVVFLDGIKI